MLVGAHYNYVRHLGRPPHLVLYPAKA